MAEKKTTKKETVEETPEVKVAAEETTTEAPKELKEREELINKLVEETMAGQHGTGRERMLSLGTNYADVQKEVVRRIRTEEA